MQKRYISAWPSFAFLGPAKERFMPNLAGLLYCMGGQTLMTQSDLLRRDEVQARLKCARSTLYALMNEAGFPRPIKLGTANRWIKTEVDAWLDRQAENRHR